jgi:peptide deformylase
MWPRPLPEEIVQIPDERLRTVSSEVQTVDDEVKKIAEELQTTIKKVDFRGHIGGLGLAAPQLGYARRIIALKSSYGKYAMMINPKVIDQKWSLRWPAQCLSLDGWHFPQRFLFMKVQYMDVEGNDQMMTVIWPRAAVLQQEIEHLDGVLISD